MAFGQKQGYPYSIPGALPQATVRQGPWPCDLPSIVPLLVCSGRNLKLNNDLWATVPKTHLINQSAINSWEP